MVKKYEAPRKALNLHQGNQFTQVKDPTVITLKPKPVVPEVIEPVVLRKKKTYEVQNEHRPKKPSFKVNLVKVKNSNIVRAEQFLTELKKQYPVIAQNYPLEIGVAKKLQETHTDVARRIVNTAMYIHTHSELYVEFLSKGMGRFDLTGKFVASIDNIGQQNALDLLAEIRKNKKGFRRK
jgi:hypothetical protein